MLPLGSRKGGESRAAAAPDGAAAVVAADEAALARVCGLTLLERNLRALARVGQRQVTVVSASRRVLEHAARRHWSRASLLVRTVLRAAVAEAPSVTIAELRELAGERPLLYVPATTVCDTRLFERLLAARESTVLVDSAPPAPLEALMADVPRSSRGLVCGPCRLEQPFLASRPERATVGEVLPEAIEEGDVRPIDVADQVAYVGSLRRTLRPVWFPAPGREHARAAEAALLDAAQKGALDIPAIVHGPVENAIVARVCRTPITPNQLTIGAAAVAWMATMLFASGHLGLGLIVALAVGVLDGLDGKLARLKLETSRVGELEHVSDFAFELSWWTSLTWHFHAAGALPWAPLVLLALYLAEGLDGLVKLAAIRRLGMLIDDAAPSMRLVRLFGGRRNVYVWIMAVGLVTGHPVAAFVLLPLWQGATAALHLAWALANMGRFRIASAARLAGT
jgi:1L-myo-inositol 1-phosphate cytidylyltransferase / CDP-L-myo-inositol myo-inositolphosphotransferase